MLFKKPIVVISGAAGSGKDTFARFMQKFLGGTQRTPALHNLKFSGALKDIVCRAWGWDRELMEDLDYKEEPLEPPMGPCKTRRHVLQFIGTAAFRALDANVWVDAAIREAREREPYVDGFVSTDCRFPNEEETIRSLFPKAYFVEVSRLIPVEISGAAHVSEQHTVKSDRFFQFANGDFEAMRESACRIAELVFGEALNGV